MPTAPGPNGSHLYSSSRILSDPWARRPVPLDGVMERGSIDEATLGFVTGLLGLGAAFLLFQFLVTPIILVLQIMGTEGGMESLLSLGEPGQILNAYTQELIVSNSIGQVVALAGFALGVARLHSSRVLRYLRVRGVDGRLMLLAGLGILGLQPVVQWLAEINQTIPLPEGMRLLEESQLEMIRQVLESDLGLVFNVGMLALVPGVCEELLFRGYAQRQFERAAGPLGGILLSGSLFGIYHLRLSQLLPLIVLGLYLAYLVWRTGSLWPAIIVHILHNGIAVGTAHVARTRTDVELETVEAISMPWYAVLGGFAIVVGVLYVLDPLARRLRED